MKNGKIVRIHVNQHEIRANGKLLNQEGCAPATLAPVLRVRTSRDILFVTAIRRFGGGLKDQW